MLNFFLRGRLYNPSGSSVPNSLLGISNLSKVLFVDPLNGNNDTAVKGSILKPYQTLTAAQAAASSGDLIWAFPGTYSITTGLAKDGITWKLDFSTVNFNSTGSMLGDTTLGSAVNYKIIGGTLNQNNTNGTLCVCNNSSTIEIKDATMTDSRNQGAVNRGSFRVLVGSTVTLRDCTVTANTNCPIVVDGGLLKAYDCYVNGANDGITACTEVRNNATGRFFNCFFTASGSTAPTISLAAVNGGLNTIELSNCFVTNTGSGYAFSTVQVGQTIKIVNGPTTFSVNTATYAISFASGSAQDVHIWDKLIVNKNPGVDAAGGSLNALIGSLVEDTDASYTV